MVIRGIQQGEVEPPVGGQLAHRARELGADHNIAVRDAAVREVALDERRRRGRRCSTNTTLAAPRLSASIPSAPDPANPSSTRAPSSAGARIANSDSLSRSEVGRNPGHVGAYEPPSLVCARNHAHRALRAGSEARPSMEPGSFLA